MKKLQTNLRRSNYEKVLIGSTLAVVLLFSGAGQSSANSIELNVGGLQAIDIENALLAVQTKRANLLEDRLKDQIDSMSNSQQMDMLRLQGLSNKRNEAFDTMTNFIKKCRIAVHQLLEICANMEGYNFAIASHFMNIIYRETFCTLNNFYQISSFLGINYIYNNYTVM